MKIATLTWLGGVEWLLSLIPCQNSHAFDVSKIGRELESQRSPNLTQRCRFNNYARCCVAWRYDAEMGTANSLHASAQYGEYNKRFGLEKVVN